MVYANISLLIVYFFLYNFLTFLNQFLALRWFLGVLSGVGFQTCGFRVRNFKTANMEVYLVAKNVRPNSLD